MSEAPWDFTHAYFMLPSLIAVRNLSTSSSLTTETAHKRWPNLLSVALLTTFAGSGCKIPVRPRENELMYSHLGQDILVVGGILPRRCMKVSGHTLDG